MDNNGGMSTGAYTEVNEIPTTLLGLWILHKPTNRVYQWDGSKYTLKSTGLVALADISVQNGNFVSWVNREPFRAVDVGQYSSDIDLINSKLSSINTEFGKSYITQTYVNGTSGYRIWSDGFKEQWGRGSSNANITLLKAFSNTSFLVVANPSVNEQYYGAFTAYVVDKQTIGTREAGHTGIVSWYACGY